MIAGGLGRLNKKLVTPKMLKTPSDNGKPLDFITDEKSNTVYTGACLFVGDGCSNESTVIMCSRKGSVCQKGCAFCI